MAAIMTVAFAVGVLLTRAAGLRRVRFFVLATLSTLAGTLIVGVFAAYVTGRALQPGATYLEVFRFAGCTAFLSYSIALWQDSIWYKRKWSTTIKNTFDGLVYGLLTAGTFGWLWPK